MTSSDGSVEPVTVFVSDALQARLDTYRDERRTATSVVFEAIEALGDRLPDVVHAARAMINSPSAREIHYLGSGPVLIRVRPDAAQAAELARLSDEVGMPVAGWLPPLLNAHLPGRKEPENMPWLVPVQQ
ncbi:MAG: hypothetical protein IJH84_07770 [Saccharopolyspora sp.]|uniref:hypothetical protein n=1 Tax=Saccharopolyspora TaxID=1835 RepID=UPI00190B89B9|nr:MULTISPECIES: hypothetical protein [unclassified Saccharopolyspora]MBK0869015.1 hypothetical protein [Saccharopolyspora sp. HNM0986]MBQ6640919.1 hypothetical protein [Saccharopolyspora sp.]